MLKALIDTDPGTDDALALMMALNSRELLVEGVTTVGGNATLAHTTRNVLRLMDYLDRQDIPVSKGAARPLRGGFHYGYCYHGPAGLGVRLPSPKTAHHPVHAPEFIVRLVSASPGHVVIIALGPLTNIARALRLEPRLGSWIKEIVVMGGAVEAPGNVTPHAEFNFYNDPLAADIVLSSPAPITLVPLDVCRLVCFARDERPWVPGSSKIAALANRIIANWFKLHPDRDLYDLCDPLALAAALQPDLLSYRQAKVKVETADNEQLGRSVAKYADGQVRVALEVDADAASSGIRRLLSGANSRPS